MGRPKGAKNGSCIKHDCFFCNKTFISHSISSKFCSRKCFYKYKKKDRNGICPKCKKHFDQRRKNGIITNRIYCSYSCSNASKKPSFFWLGKKRPEMRGKKNPSWVANPKNDESKLWRWRIEYRTWRKGVFIRDGYNCQKCKKKGGELHPHHILNFSSNVKLRFVIDNGITFCIKHHKEFHKKYGVKNNTKEQVFEFIT